MLNKASFNFLSQAFGPDMFRFRENYKTQEFRRK